MKALPTIQERLLAVRRAQPAAMREAQLKALRRDVAVRESWAKRWGWQ